MKRPSSTNAVSSSRAALGSAVVLLAASFCSGGCSSAGKSGATDAATGGNAGGGATAGNGGGSGADVAGGAGGSAGSGGAAGASGAGGSAGAGGGGGAPAPAACDPGSKTGGDMGSAKTAGGLGIYIRVPTNYDPTVASPLVVLYGECCDLEASSLEMHTAGFSDAALPRGYMVAYTDSVSPNSDQNVADAATVANIVSAKWCVDQHRIFLSGNSDGGTMAFSVPIFAPGVVPTAGIAPSAVGADSPTLMSTPCIEDLPLAAFIMHSNQDTTFPVAWGRYQAQWSAMCNGCDATPTAPRADGCIQYPNCMGGVLVLYCEGNLPHAAWPGQINNYAFNQSIIDFFDASYLP